MAAAATSCFVVVLALCLLVSMALMAGHYYGRAELVAGPGCSRLVRANPLFVQDITVRAAEEEGSGASGLVLYGLAEIPGLLDDVPAVWSEARRVVLPANSHKEWVYFLNSGSQIEVNCSVEPGTGLTNPLRITIAQGKVGFTQWSEEPSVHGTGAVRQSINSSDDYYVTVSNLRDQDTTVTLDFRISAVLYNTSGAEYACSPSPGSSGCTYRLPILGENVAVLSSGLKQGVKVELSYGPRWIVYFVGSAILAVSLLLLYEVLSVLLGFCCAVVADQRTTTATTTASLLECKEEEEGGSRGSSFESVSSHDGEAGDEEEGRRLCVVCCDARRDCFFMPCGHSATCHACGTKIVEGDASCCPFCRRKLKKVRRIFCV
ncbi:E3 ubiquitin-protein ligase APD2 isoform X3 [Aegilops tauschii subsp. strangulata]|uniref:E3 ubiquitin-protein ligase APD2 isoform X3 n=1 Tax=Aegilops tauschii subsp. strangulata TaxID=200361 RepID=UPI00098BABE4|nr:E3 ubiquitin-protein ligase APD2 isoform X3 [Aegilops tauschii subsp. strangulata]